MSGGYLRRATMMLAISPIFTVWVALVWKRFCSSQGLPIVKSSFSLLLFLFRDWRLASFGPHWLTWFKPGFHPGVTDKTEAAALETRRAELDAKRVPLNKESMHDKEMRGPILLGPSATASVSMLQSN